MALTKEQKKKIVNDLKDKVKRQKVMILVSFTGLKVKEFFELKNKLKSVNSQIKVIKKTLLNLVLKEFSPDFSQKVAQFKTQIAIVFGFENEISPTKVLYQFALGNQNLKILGGYLEKRLRESEEIITLAQLPTRDELLARFVGNLAAPVSNFVNILEANLKGLVFVLSKLKSNQ
jgi:large subunit ribosomal protein L10